MTPDHDNQLAAGAASTSQRLVPANAGKSPLALRLAAYAAALAPAAFPIADPASSSAYGDIVRVTISGTYDTSELNFRSIPLFGPVPGPVTPFSYSIDIDTDLDTDASFIPTGGPAPGGPPTHEFHAYSLASIVGSSLTLNNQTWTMPELVPLIDWSPEWGGRYLWMDAQLPGGKPTRVLLQANRASPRRELRIGYYPAGASEAIERFSLVGAPDEFPPRFPFEPPVEIFGSTSITTQVLSRTYSRVDSTIDSGGATRTSTDNLYTMRATIGQHDAAPPSTGSGGSGSFTLLPGYWGRVPAPPPPVCVGDLTLDGLRNTADLAQFLGNFGQTVPPALARADLNGDGAVNTADLVIFLGNFGVPCPTP